MLYLALLKPKCKYYKYCHLDSDGTESEKRAGQLLALVVLLACVVVPLFQFFVLIYWYIGILVYCLQTIYTVQ